MRARQQLPAGQHLVSPNGMQMRDDIFLPRHQGSSDLGSGLNDREGNPDVNRVEPWSIWAFAWAQDGGSADWSALHWRYRIWVPSSFPACEASWFLSVTPRAVLTGRYDLIALTLLSLFGVSSARVVHRFWTGTWHWRNTAGTWTPTWNGWRPSYNVVDHSVSVWGNVSQSISVGYPGTAVQTPMEIPPPGVSIQPNPVNDYGIVAPSDVVDFYVRPELIVTTTGAPSYAKLDLSLIDVPFVIAEYACHGFYL
ncbi:MAG TPA: hypothetical protein DCK98_11545 [Chloroflexi bacterium]|nr:hypothetical protein [Chloroflexota bacterium]HAL28146.1 hypothetical protein [Chloroflexota bacterium]